MELNDYNIAVLDDLHQLLRDEGFEMYNVEVGSRFEPGEESNPTEITCTIVEE
jgi:hypothetical protein